MSVCCGATVTQSPVWTPIGSTFSIEQTITTLSAPSRMTSSSNSPQPSTDSSISTWPIGDAASPRATIALELVLGAGDAAAAAAERERRADDQRQPERLERGARACAKSVAIVLRAVRRPAACIVASNSSRSSARQIAS